MCIYYFILWSSTIEICFEIIRRVIASVSQIDWKGTQGKFLGRQKYDRGVFFMTASISKNLHLSFVHFNVCKWYLQNHYNYPHHNHHHYHHCILESGEWEELQMKQEWQNRENFCSWEKDIQNLLCYLIYLMNSKLSIIIEKIPNQIR